MITTPSLLPQNLSAEQSAVSILAQIEGALTAYPWDERMFLDPNCRRVFLAIVEARAKGAATGKRDLLSRMEASGELEAVGGEYGLESLLETYPLLPSASPGHAEWLHQDLVAACSRRQIILTHAKLESDLRSGHITGEDYLTAITDAATMPESRKRDTLATQLASLIDEIENRNPPESFGFGIPTVDRELDGGFQRGELTTVAGPTGGGKSLLLAQAALNAARAGKAVVFFSLEMPAKAVLRRLVANLANVALPKPHETLFDQQLKAIKPAINGIAKMPLVILDNLHSLAEIEAESRRLIKLGKADIVVVDYVQRVRHTKADTREQAVAEVTSRLKSLALQSACAVLTASQLNKQGDVRESAAIEFDSDIVLKITDDGILCQKFRRGASNFVVPVTMQGALGRFDGEITEWTEAA
jgi:replicative DNA helicase